MGEHNSLIEEAKRRGFGKGCKFIDYDGRTQEIDKDGFYNWNSNIALAVSTKTKPTNSFTTIHIKENSYYRDNGGWAKVIRPARTAAIQTFKIY